VESLIKGSGTLIEVEVEGEDRPGSREPCETILPAERATAIGTLSTVETIRTPESDHDVLMLGLAPTETRSLVCLRGVKRVPDSREWNTTKTIMENRAHQSR